MPLKVHPSRHVCIVGLWGCDSNLDNFLRRPIRDNNNHRLVLFGLFISFLSLFSRFLSILFDIQYSIQNRHYILWLVSAFHFHWVIDIFQPIKSRPIWWPNKSRCRFLAGVHLLPLCSRLTPWHERYGSVLDSLFVFVCVFFLNFQWIFSFRPGCCSIQIKHTKLEKFFLFLFRSRKILFGFEIKKRDESLYEKRPDRCFSLSLLKTMYFFSPCCGDSLRSCCCCWLVLLLLVSVAAGWLVLLLVVPCCSLVDWRRCRHVLFFGVD